MADEPERFNEEEVGLILRRAAEVQVGRSMTLAELESVAAEAGIDAALVRRAATEVRSRQDPPTVSGGGVFGPTLLVYERRIDGNVDPSAWEDLVAEIRRRMKMKGSIEQVGKELVWSSNPRPGSGKRDIRVVVTSRRGYTLVRVEERTGGLAGGLYGGLMGGLLPFGLAWILPICIAALQTPVLIPLLIPVWVLASYWLARTIYRTALESRQRELQALADGLTESCAEVAALPPARSETGAA
jgi:hypothetical protein